MTDDPTSEGRQPPKRRQKRRRRKPRAASNADTASNAAAGKTGNTRKPASAKKRSATKRRASSPVQREVSAGGVVYRREGDDIEVVLASRRTRRGDLAWGLAKGGIEPGETHADAAVREVLEETGYTVDVEASLGDTRYFYVWENTRIRKTVHFFLMRCTGGDPADRDDEMEEIRWFPLERALKRAAYRGERDVLGRAAEMLR
ncbi:MAG: NUDIX hydrolase [Actinomycetota bacterium]|nr:NUDIX hydrolase [Actinomycetota bacterium]MDH5223458.1 NUDIX hydrolase [Actinomycetota bacterium]MDH5312536.1 NUDIX hydrolase [Actinomycetota bacterium]